MAVEDVAVFRPGDAREVRRLVRESLHTLYDVAFEGEPVYSGDQIEAMKRSTPGQLIRDGQRGTLLVTKAGEEIVGVGGLRPYAAADDPHLEGFSPEEGKTGIIICAYVKPTWQHRGVFQGLVVGVVRKAEERGYQELFSYAVRDPRVRRLYVDKLGCRVVGEVSRRRGGFGLWGQYYGRVDVPFTVITGKTSDIRSRVDALARRMAGASPLEITSP